MPSAAPENESDPETFVALFWRGADEWNQRYESFRKTNRDAPAPSEIAKIRVKADVNLNFRSALETLEEIRSCRDPAPDRLLVAFALGFAAAASTFVNRTPPSEWKKLSKLVKVTHAQLDDLSASIDALDSDLIHGPKESRAALSTPSSETPREAIQRLRAWIDLKRPAAAASNEHETVLSHVKGKPPAWPVRKMAQQLTGLLDHMLGDPCTGQTAQIIRVFTGATLNAKDIDSLRR